VANPVHSNRYDRQTINLCIWLLEIEATAMRQRVPPPFGTRVRLPESIQQKTHTTTRTHIVIPDLHRSKPRMPSPEGTPCNRTRTHSRRFPRLTNLYRVT
jgi:hypothetical protein